MENPLMNQERNGETSEHLRSDDGALNGGAKTQGAGGGNGEGGSAAGAAEPRDLLTAKGIKGNRGRTRAFFRGNTE
jgi:hypothetical protein